MLLPMLAASLFKESRAGVGAYRARSLARSRVWAGAGVMTSWCSWSWTRAAVGTRYGSMVRTSSRSIRLSVCGSASSSRYF